jgi:hypothetical protein
MSFNLHLMTHLCDYVERFGPTWTHSNFPYENFNKELLAGCHGTTHYLKQIASSMQRTRALDYLESHMPAVKDPMVISTLAHMDGHSKLPDAVR